MEAINACPHHGFDTWLLVSLGPLGILAPLKSNYKVDLTSHYKESTKF